MNVVTGLYLITIITKILKRDGSLVTAEELMDIQDTVTVFVQMNPRLRSGQSLLHLALNAQTPVDDFHTNDVCQFPNLDVARLLLCCKARVNDFDRKLNTPLHILIANVRGLEGNHQKQKSNTRIFIFRRNIRNSLWTSDSNWSRRSSRCADNLAAIWMRSMAMDRLLQTWPNPTR